MAVRAKNAPGAPARTRKSSAGEPQESRAEDAGVLDRSLDETERLRSAGPPSRRIEGIVIGRVATAGYGSTIAVDYPGNAAGSPIAAVSTVAVTARDVDRQVALAFEGGNPAKPIILALIHHPAMEDTSERPVAIEADGQELDVRVDGERITLSAEKEIVLRCGKASITLTRAGKILIRGAYLLSRSSGANRIKGAIVEIN